MKKLTRSETRALDEIHAHNAAGRLPASAALRAHRNTLRALARKGLASIYLPRVGVDGWRLEEKGRAEIARR